MKVFLARFHNLVRFLQYWLICYYCANPKPVNTRIISGMLLCCEEKANQMQISYLIGHCTFKMSKSNQSMLVKKGQYNKISVYTIKSQYMQQDVHIYNIISINTTRFLYIQQVFIIYNKISIYTTSFHYIQQEFYIYNMMCMYTTTFPICTTRII